jgi:hypothetical protein
MITSADQQYGNNTLMTWCMSVGGPVLSGNMGTRPAHVYYMYIGKSARVRADHNIFSAHKRADRCFFSGARANLFNFLGAQARRPLIFFSAPRVDPNIFFGAARRPDQYFFRRLRADPRHR